MNTITQAVIAALPYLALALLIPVGLYLNYRAITIGDAQRELTERKQRDAPYRDTRPVTFSPLFIFLIVVCVCILLAAGLRA